MLSTSSFARRTWIPSVQQCRFGEVSALASRDGGAARRVADELGIATAYGSYDDLLADKAVDAVYIPLPNHLHAQWAIAAAEAGKHVLCEKPLALSIEEGEAMAAAAAAAGVLLMEGFMYRFHPAWVAVHEIVTSGRIGTLQAMEGWFSYYNDDGANIRNRAEAGGGALNDIGCYPISVARWLFGAEPVRVRGAIQRDPGTGVDTVTAALLEFPGQGLACIGCSSRAEPDQWIRAHGTDGHVSIGIPFNIPFDRPIEVRIVAGGSPPVAPTAEVLEVPAANQYTLMADAFARAVLDGAAAPTPVSDALGNQRVMTAIIEDASSA